MTFIDTWVGDIDDPDFNWDGGNWNGNVPKRKSPLFPPCRNGRINMIFDEWVKHSNIIHKQVDWGASAARVTKYQLNQFIAYCYSKELSDIAPDLHRFIEHLEEDRLYILVIAES